MKTWYVKPTWATLVTQDPRGPPARKERRLALTMEDRNHLGTNRTRVETIAQLAVRYPTPVQHSATWWT